MSALASLDMGSLNRSTVQDLCDANMAVERLKAEPFLGIKLPHILHSQQCAGLLFRTLLGLTLPRITVKEPCWLVQFHPNCGTTLRLPFALLSHESHCLKRKCPCTSAAETQIMSEALAEVEWIRWLRRRADQSPSQHRRVGSQISEPWSLDSRSFVGR